MDYKIKIREPPLVVMKRYNKKTDGREGCNYAETKADTT